jgi:uncharacterized membrane protein YdjX (TVP38/TMEM64 family)
MVGDGSMMMFGMGLWWLLWIVVIGLIAAAAIKYLFFHPTGRERRSPRDDGPGSPGP